MIHNKAFGHASSTVRPAIDEKCPVLALVLILRQRIMNDESREPWETSYEQCLKENLLSHQRGRETDDLRCFDGLRCIMSPSWRAAASQIYSIFIFLRQLILFSLSDYGLSS